MQSQIGRTSDNALLAADAQTRRLLAGQRPLAIQVSWCACGDLAVGVRRASPMAKTLGEMEALGA